MTKSAGWAGKLSPEALAQVLSQLPVIKDENLLVGIGTSDDAAVYRLNSEQGVVFTTDFFTPVVDDPYTFGLIAAANSLSDVYAMGGEPLLALNIICFPSGLPLDIMGQILKGGADKTAKAGCILAGGHSVEDSEPKYGLAVLGLVHPDKMFTNAKAKVGDLLILTKPLGVGILNTAIKADLLSLEAMERAIETMTYLNKDAALAAKEVGVEGCTDITGFGFLGHALEMAEASGVSLEIWADAIPVLPESVNLAKGGIIPGGAYNNAHFIGSKVQFQDEVDQAIRDILFDPQTSGGLLLAVPEEKAPRLLEILEATNKTPYAVVGRVKAKDRFALEVKKNKV